MPHLTTQSQPMSNERDKSRGHARVSDAGVNSHKQLTKHRDNRQLYFDDLKERSHQEKEEKENQEKSHPCGCPSRPLTCGSPSRPLTPVTSVDGHLDQELHQPMADLIDTSTFLRHTQQRLED